jgi:Leucine-rich repeat (LRR) protein
MICLSIYRCFIQLYLLSHFQLNSYSLIHQVPNYFVHCSVCRFVFVFFSTICSATRTERTESRWVFMHLMLNSLLILGQLKPVRLNFLEINISSRLDPTIYSHIISTLISQTHFVAAFCELKRLKHLTRLFLLNNELEGVIPSCLGMIANLQRLFLSNNRLHGNLPPSIFSKQSKIAMFDVSDNQLDGVLSFSIFANASSLIDLDLSINYDLEVETESPSWVPTFQLVSLGLASCNINKKNGHVVPSFISSQFSLDYLELSNTAIEGSIPCQLFFNTSIRRLFLKSNKIDGFFLDCFANRTSSLEVLDISDNHVKGCLPEYVGHVLSHLLLVNTSSNALEGKIPWSFGNLTLEILDLSYNMFS